jgi:hypothetical protein
MQKLRCMTLPMYSIFALLQRSGVLTLLSSLTAMHPPLLSGGGGIVTITEQRSYTVSRP